MNKRTVTLTGQQYIDIITAIKRGSYSKIYWHSPKTNRNGFTEPYKITIIQTMEV